MKEHLQAYIKPIIERISNREEVLNRIIFNFKESVRKFNGLEKAAASVLNNDNEANTRKMLNTTMNIVKDQMEINQDVLSILLLYVSDDSFTTAQAEFAVKTGHATYDSILQKMMKDKFNGGGK